MKLTAKTLPNDPELLKQMLLAMAGKVDQLSTHNTYLETRVSQLELQIKLHRKRQFGRSSESGQYELEMEDITTVQAEIEQVKQGFEHSTASTPAKPNRTRKPFPAELPREEKTFVPEACSCPDCGQSMQNIGEDVSEVLDIVPAKYRVIKVIRPKFGCKACNKISQAPAAERVIDRGIASAALIAQVIVDKYADHLPLYRQAERFQREGIDLDRSTLAGWAGRVGALLLPLTNAIRAHVMEAHKLHADDTTAPTLVPGNGKTATGRYWNYVRDDRPWDPRSAPAVWFQYSTTRSGDEPLRHLKGYKGIIQTDAYAGYNGALQQGVHRAGCWAHARRKFFELVDAGKSEVAADAVNRINQLYAIEKEIKSLPPDERSRIRKIKSQPILDDLKLWLDEHIRQCVKGSPMARAINYTRKQWDDLILYVSDGKVEIDNNAAERAIRPLVVGRKNHLFAGSELGGHTGAALYSIMGTAKLNGIDPKAYLTAVLKRINCTPITEVAELLPWNINLDEARYAEAI